MWNWHAGKAALEWLFYTGALTARERTAAFERVYDLPERVLPAEVLAVPTPDRPTRSASWCAPRPGPWGWPPRPTFATTSGCPWPTPGRPSPSSRRTARCSRSRCRVGPPAWLDPAARRPRRVRARALLSPFDSLVWERPRVERIFGFRYRLEIYTPAAKRVHGYYVLPFLLGDQLVARVDLKADRQAGVLRVQAAHAEEGSPTRSSPPSSPTNCGSWRGGWSWTRWRWPNAATWRPELRRVLAPPPGGHPGLRSARPGAGRVGPGAGVRGGRPYPRPRAQIVPLKVQVIAQTQFAAPEDVPWDTDVDGGQALAEFAGRACYQSWSKPNPATASNAGYLRHILEVGHLSVLEHGTVSMYLSGGLPVAAPTSSSGTGTSPTASSPSATCPSGTPPSSSRASSPRTRNCTSGSSPRPTPRWPPTATCSRAWRRSSPTSRTARCAASRPGRPPARSCPMRPRRGSWSPATTAPGGTSSPCGPASTPTSRSASWPSPACASCSGCAGNVFDDFRISELADGTEVAASPYVGEG